MTDKETIIDGVDVSKCRWHTNLIMDCLEIPLQPCKCTNDKNCYYKQLKHKEQECEELKEELRGCRIGIKDISIENTEICKISEKYKRVFDEIEKQVKAINNDCFYDDICNCNNCDMKNGCTYYRKFNILNIINKAKETNSAR